MIGCYNDGLARAEDQWVLGSPRRDAPKKVDPDAEENWVAHDTGNTVQRNRVTGKFRTRPGYVPPDPPAKSYDYPVIIGVDFGHESCGAVAVIYNDGPLPLIVDRVFMTARRCGKTRFTFAPSKVDSAEVRDAHARLNQIWRERIAGLAPT